MTSSGTTPVGCGTLSSLTAVKVTASDTHLTSKGLEFWVATAPLILAPVEGL